MDIKPPEAHVPKHPDKETARRLYFESRHVSWVDFASEQGWDIHGSRLKYPVANWAAEKRQKIAEAHVEDVKASVFEHRITYRKDVLRTLRDYPETNDAIHQLIRRKVADITREVAESKTGKKVVLDKKGKQVEVDILDSEELVKLALAMKTITESKHRSLLLSDVVARVAEQAPPTVETGEEEGEDAASQGFRLEVMGMGEVSLRDLQRLQLEYVDRPAGVPSKAPSGEPQKTEADPLQALVDGDPR